MFSAVYRVINRAIFAQKSHQFSVKIDHFRSEIWIISWHQLMIELEISLPYGISTLKRWKHPRPTWGLMGVRPILICQNNMIYCQLFRISKEYQDEYDAYMLNSLHKQSFSQWFVGMSHTSWVIIYESSTKMVKFLEISKILEF